MIVRNCDGLALERAAERAGVRIKAWAPAGPRAIRFTLGLAGDRQYQRRGFCRVNGGPARRVAAVCWHGHREFFRALFVVCPGARVQTAKTRAFAKGQRWYTAENFERCYEATDGNIGSVYQPLWYSEACDCGA